MSALAENFTSDLFASDDPRFDGVRRLLTRAGIEITTPDLVTAAEADGGLSFDRLSELCLVLGLEPRVATAPLGTLMLGETLFAFEQADGTLWFFLPGSDGTLSCLDLEGAEPHVRPAADIEGRALVFSAPGQAGRDGTASGPIRSILAWTGKPLIAVVGLTFASNILGLSLPLFTLAVYDQVLAAGDRTMLAVLVVGLGLALLADIVLRVMRSKMVSRGAAHLDARMSSRLFGSALRRAEGNSLTAAPATLQRLRDIDRIRGFLFGPIGIGLIEAPFALIYIGILALMLGWVAIVPIGFLAIGFALTLVLLGSVSRRGRAALARTEEYGALCTEIAGRLGTIRAEDCGAVYESRFRDASARLGEAELLQQRSGQILQLVSGVLVSFAVLLTLASGAVVAMGSGLSVGALIASIALVWRLSAPLPAMLQARSRWPEIKEALISTAALLDPATEKTTREGISGGRTMSGQVAFSSVNFTYGRGQTAAIRNLSFEIGAGELVAITGHCGSGKSTLLDLVSGILAPQFGAVTIDGVNPQQVAPSTLRQSIGYMPSEAIGLPASIHDFLRIGVDPADRWELGDICDRLGLTSAVGALPRGEDTLMVDLDEGSGLVQGLSLARVIATNASLLLLDEPDAASKTARAGLVAELKRLKGTSTVMIVTHEPSFIEIADRVLVLKAGALGRVCAPKDITKRQGR